MSFQLTQGMVLEDFDGTTIIIAENGDSAVLNGSASMIVDVLLESLTIDEAAERLFDVYSVERAVLIKDVRSIIEDLVQQRMMEEMGS